MRTIWLGVLTLRLLVCVSLKNRGFMDIFFSFLMGNIQNKVYLRLFEPFKGTLHIALVFFF